MFRRSRAPNVKITSPCKQDWNSMPVRSDGHRYCQACEKVVHNLANMTGREVRQLFAKSEGRVCTHARYDESGALVVRPEPLRSGSGFIPVSVLTAVTAAVPSLAFGQASGGKSCKVQIAIHDPSGAPVPSSKVTFAEEGKEGESGLSGTADQQGIFTGETKAGTYKVAVQSLGFVGWTREHAEVNCTDALTPVELVADLEVGSVGGGAICKKPNIFRRSWTKLSSNLRTTRSTTN